MIIEKLRRVRKQEGGFIFIQCTSSAQELMIVKPGALDFENRLKNKRQKISKTNLVSGLYISSSVVNFT